MKSRNKNNVIEFYEFSKSFGSGALDKLLNVANILKPSPPPKP